VTNIPAQLDQNSADQAFAEGVVLRLQQDGHTAFLAGGCVRDKLLGRRPTDYDVASSARPEQVRQLFGHRKTIAVGAAFGVITVLGPRGTHAVDVATFRTDSSYSDGRHPDGVVFSTPEHDAERRDFTINGLFLNPTTGEVHDFVGGKNDLASGVIRAIGDPTKRFSEDHLRMLRAVRFSATFNFALHDNTLSAIKAMRHRVGTVSPERIAHEIRRMFTSPGREKAFDVLLDTELAPEIFPELWSASTHQAMKSEWEHASRVIGTLEEPELGTALAALFETAGEAAMQQAAHRLRLSNRDTHVSCWLLKGIRYIDAAPTTGLKDMPWSSVQPWVAHQDASLLIDLMRARAKYGRGNPENAAWMALQTRKTKDELNPPPILNGNDLISLGIPSGEKIGEVLSTLRNKQLDGEITDRDAALRWAAQHAAP